MLPPSWAVSSGTRLDLDGFGAAFSQAWSRTESRFLKLECWQAYREGHACESQEVYERGDMETARELLRREAEADRPLYEDVEKRHIDYSRIRLVREPLSPYLQYELLSYRIRAQMGENIEVVRCDSTVRLPSDEYFDVLLFDRREALIHDYGTGDVGWQSGGWLIEEPYVLARLEEMILALRDGAIPLRRYPGRARTEQF
ncbi:DUF6879 family protein [Actinoallomurus acaciae]|uniref:DUF6879 family protein n=1 Tax=Actinoallomurus acaciae TaxID=502577 RepID=A0ABV5YWS7_9ACTN